MTRENRMKSAATELRRAQQAMLEAEALARGGLCNGATSRAYYVVFHAAGPTTLRHSPGRGQPALASTRALRAD